MKSNNISTTSKVLLRFICGVLFSFPALAVEIIIKEELIPVADNAIFLMDTSSSMNEDFRDTNSKKRTLVESEFEKRNGEFPDIDINFGIYAYTPWEEFYSVQPYDREKIAAALDAVEKKTPGPTPLKKGLENLEEVLKPLSGRTAVFVFSDGTYTGRSPTDTAKKIAQNYDVCFYVISTAKEGKNTKLHEDVAALNACSRLIPLEKYLNKPEYQSGALYVVKATLAGVRVENNSFEFDKSELNDTDIAELDELAVILNADPESYAILSGYTDNTGDEDYNEDLSRRRTESVANYLIDKHGVDEGQLVLLWYGSDNPLVSNDTPENKAINRRVEIAVGGI